MPLQPFLKNKIPKWAVYIFVGYEVLQSLLLQGLVKYLSNQGSQYVYQKSAPSGPSAPKVKYTQAQTAEDSQTDISNHQTNPDLDLSRVEKEKKIESIDGYEI